MWIERVSCFLAFCPEMQKLFSRWCFPFKTSIKQRLGNNGEFFDLLLACRTPLVVQPLALFACVCVYACLSACLSVCVGIWMCTCTTVFLTLIGIIYNHAPNLCAGIGVYISNMEDKLMTPGKYTLADDHLDSILQKVCLQFVLFLLHQPVCFTVLQAFKK